jgi:hypothetical protein
MVLFKGKKYFTVSGSVDRLLFEKPCHKLNNHWQYRQDYHERQQLRYHVYEGCEVEGNGHLSHPL